MTSRPEVSQVAVDRVVAAGMLYAGAAAQLANPERETVCHALGKTSESFRLAHKAIGRFELGFTYGVILALFCVLSIFGDVPRWVPASLGIAAIVVLGVPAIKAYRAAWKLLDVAVGACVVASKGGNDVVE
ncbi:hypothetical protein NLX83_10700 [Allokutzneria sp. A3M-2-11 16]|uniref:hypothetical protein n=1 Tax=Allokutzneria sp. A3M-2-11 16 TaxID=2962043 RepID=UPI0020B83C17|nr:hypothetical protein [Allokutzneria sp. A3M-2-11 16]MCP3799727.1 hypothetical protein [Allokutzneria sp. A3M-2-11 16]